MIISLLKLTQNINPARSKMNYQELYWDNFLHVVCNANKKNSFNFGELKYVVCKANKKNSFNLGQLKYVV